MAHTKPYGRAEVSEKNTYKLRRESGGFSVPPLVFTGMACYTARETSCTYN